MDRGSPASSNRFRQNKWSIDAFRMIPTKEIQAELDRIFSSDAFTNANRMKRFLKYVVDQSFHGKDDDLSEYSIGLRVYDRDDSFDPRLDSIVRVDAARLRSKLREFYDSEGKANPIRIEIPKGGYKAIFYKGKGPRPEISKQRPVKETSVAKTIAVLPFVDLSPQRDQEYFGDGIAEELMFALSRVPKLRVVSQTSVFAFKGKGMDVRDIGSQLGVENILEGSVRKGRPDASHYSATH